MDNKINIPCISFAPISFTIPDFVIPDIKMPPCNISFAPIVFGHPIPSGSPNPPPFMISVQTPVPLPKINVSWGEPPQISCVLFVQSPGTTYQEFLDMKQEHNVEPTTEEKCKAILLRIVELINEEDKPIGFEQDLGHWTATITKGKMHTHVGIPGPDGSFDIFVNNLYDLLIKNKGLSWA